ncbi:hypothetical protein ABT187_48945 [Streptomyces sp. NPDC001817]|uniref:hypothetical protein n=1 Tax=Streptomyces sp. NPDC001817 TaxID=3154398 RepID=UPI0033336958
MLALTGPGSASADQALGLDPWPAWVSATALVVGPVSGLLVRALLHRGSVGRSI